jgi:surface protein
MNKERLQNYNEILIENNVSLENINNTIKELPDVSEMIEKFEINDASYLFYNGARLNNLDLILKLCKKLTSTKFMFRDCKNITDLNLNCINTSLVSDMLSMFESCNKLVNLDISNFDFSSVVTAQNMFDGCSKLISTGIKKFKLPLNQTMYHMFYNCRELTDIDFSESHYSRFYLQKNPIYRGLQSVSICFTLRQKRHCVIMSKLLRCA